MNIGCAKREHRVLALACSVSALLFALGPSYAEVNGQANQDGGVSSAEVTVAPDLALAEVYEEGVSLDDYWVSEKLDGVRAYWDGGQLISRGGHRIEAPADFVRGLPAERLDGELWMGRGRFEETSGMTSSGDSLLIFPASAETELQTSRNDCPKIYKLLILLAPYGYRTFGGNCVPVSL